MSDKTMPGKEENPAKRLIFALCKPEAYAFDVKKIIVIETHISWVLLVGSFAYKIKKPVKFGFLDFSTLRKRHYFCEQELRLNRRLAPDLYLSVAPITGTADNPEMEGCGEIIEYAVKMRRFPAGQLLSELAARGELPAAHIDRMADMIAVFHKSAQIATPAQPFGQTEDILQWFQQNIRQIRPLLENRQRLQQLQRLQSWGQQQWNNNQALMKRRKEQGFIRECHGDLHLGNMALIDERITAFDCIEFNAEYRWIDVLNEVAFVVMDLMHRGLGKYAYRFLNRYLLHSGDYHGLKLLSYFLTYRALVRAMVSILQSTQHADEQTVAAAYYSDYEAYADLAESFTRPVKTAVIIMHGFSASGKSTIAGRVAENLPAIYIRSDVERKRLFGFPAFAATGSALNGGIYNSDANNRTYQRLAEISEILLDAGFPVIVDAAFLGSKQRVMFRGIADRLAAPFFIIDCTLGKQLLIERIGRRLQKAEDPSEATISVLQQQWRTAEPLTKEEKRFVLTVDTSDANAIATLMTRLKW